jgi:RluA family pseudouridine synthase
MTWQLLAELDGCLLVCKPFGLPTQAPPGFDSLESQIRAWLRLRLCQPDPYLAIPHRLDRPVSGAMVFATQRAVARKISRQFERRRVRKIYWACVQGIVDPPEGTWHDHLYKVHGQPRAEVVPAEHPLGRTATLHYRTLGKTPYGSWLEIELETGRTHQIRVQAAARGCPVLGDALYGSTVPFGPQHADERRRGIALHARSLQLMHPHTQQPLSATAPLPPEWLALGVTDLPAP